MTRNATLIDIAAMQALHETEDLLDLRCGDDSDAQKIVHAIVAAVTPLIRAAALEEASEWKTMENAPKDGTHFLWCEELRGRCAVIYWPTYKECFTTGYWHPLPPPPAESSAA